MAEGGIAGTKDTHGNGRWHLSQGVFGLVGKGLSAEQLPDGLRGGQQVDQGQKGLQEERKAGYERAEVQGE